ncbi:RxLR effector protein [Phytophthora megakarya]|uniref:RxLR effector protein n=1 Tax=Phytophthora megakarya TaxID=4795 RepID=A0A225WIS8_9STRA|nr:RxLR effector protein [Phytophthora megakarya]
MRRFHIVLLIAFQVCVGLSTINGERYAKNYQGVVHRLLRAYESKKESREERGITDKILLQWNKMKLEDDIAVALKNPRVGAMWKQVEKINNDKPPGEKISLVGKFMKKYGDDDVMTAIKNANELGGTNAIATKLGSDLVVNYRTIFKGAAYQGKDLDDVLTKGLGENNVLPFIAKALAKGPSKKKTEELKNLESKILMEKLQDQMKILKMDDEMKAIFSNPNLGKLTKYMKELEGRFPANQASFLRILTLKYGDDEVAKGLALATAGVENPIAKALQRQQFARWWNDEKTVDDVFKQMKIKENDLNFVDSRGLGVFEDYTLYLHQETFIGALSRLYGGESKLAWWVEKARQRGDNIGRHTRENAEALQKKLFQQWQEDGVNMINIYEKKFKVTNEAAASMGQKEVASAFKTFLSNPPVVNPTRSGRLIDSISSGKLKLNKFLVGSALKNTKKMEKLWTHVDDFNKGRIATEKITVTGSLMEKYGDDAVMAAIVKAKRAESTKEVATKLETDLVLNYATIFKGVKYQGKDIDDVLMKGFGGEKSILAIIGAAKKKPLTMTKITELNKLETKMFVKYVERQMNTNLDLPLDGGLTTILSSNYLGKLDRAITRMSSKFPDNDLSFIRVLRAKYDDQAVAKAIVDGKAAEGSTDIVKKLQRQYLKALGKEGKPTDDFVKLLNNFA